MKKTDVLVIGGGPAGIIAAVTAKKKNNDKEVIVVRDMEKGVVPCGIPYVFNRLDSVEKNIMPDKSLVANNIDLIINKVKKVDFKKKIAILEDEEEIQYDKLILATGSRETVAKIDNIDKPGVWFVKKDFEYLKKMREAVLAAKKIVIIGGGYIGMEFAEELSAIKDLEISIIEKGEHCLGTTLDDEFALEIEEKLQEKKVKIIKNSFVQKIKFSEKVEGVELSDGSEIPADLVIVSIGAQPNTALFENTELELGAYKAIKVDEYMQTNISNVFAVGDCAETKDFFTKKVSPIMLASTACYEARIAGVNLYTDKKQENKGTLAVFSSYICGTAISVVGLTEKMKDQENFSSCLENIVVGESECTSHHPGTLPDTQKVKTKLIFSKKDGLLLGAQILGPASVGEMINILALAIEKEATAYDLSMLQVATHPLLTPAPTVYPLISAARSVLGQL